MPSLNFSAWMKPGDAAALASLEAHAGMLSRLYPLWYFSGPDGLPARRPEAGAETRKRASALAQASGVEVWPHVGVSLSPRPGLDEGLGRLLADLGLRRAHGEALLRLAREDGARGLDLDYGPVPAVHRAAYKGWIAELGALARGAGLKLGLVVRAGALVSAASEFAGTLEDAAPFCDRLHLVGNYPGLGGPGSDDELGPLAPLDWCAAVLARAAGLASSGKLEWGLPGFGRAWGSAGPATDLDWDGWRSLARAHPPERRDPATSELCLRHAGGEAWMNDSISLTAKLWQMRLHGVGQAALWGLGAEDPRLWALLDSLPKDFLAARGL